MLTSSVLSIERVGPVGLIWLDRAAKYNALSTELWSAIPNAIAELTGDATIKAIVLAGRGKHFCVGIDLMENVIGSEEPRSGSSEAIENLRKLENTGNFQAAISSLADSALPVIAVVHGHCLGAGIDLISACDIRVCSADANFSVRETRIGIVADVGTLQRLPKIVSAGHVAELAYTGKDIDARRAEKIGLVNDSYDSFDNAFAAGMALAHDISANSTLAVRGTKFMLRKSENLSTDQSLTLNAMFTLLTSLKSNDLKESIDAFMSRRPPNYTGS